MTPGQYFFFGGIGMFVLTLLVSVVFLIKKPKYEPNSVSYTGDGATGKLHSGYPTDRMTVVRQASSSPKASVPVSSGTQPLEGTTPLKQGTTPLEQGTTPLEQGTTPLVQGTTPLEQGTTPLAQETTPLEQVTVPLEQETMPLG